ncbi:IS66 family insertion sequence element accessory protein TnpB [Sulfitobacter maritimus]|uniref:IS66 family insertion sequence element accessory protein TnpB n=1 Tax=Sulfitobacter maritimus TaxID=2741719 RepID=UPI003CCDFD6A
MHDWPGHRCACVSGLRCHGYAQGIAGLAALTQDVLRQKPTSGAVFAFRGHRGDRIKLVLFEIST